MPPRRRRRRRPRRSPPARRAGESRGAGRRAVGRLVAVAVQLGAPGAGLHREDGQRAGPLRRLVGDQRRRSLVGRRRTGVEHGERRPRDALEQAPLHVGQAGGAPRQVREHGGGRLGVGQRPVGAATRARAPRRGPAARAGRAPGRAAARPRACRTSRRSAAPRRCAAPPPPGARGRRPRCARRGWRRRRTRAGRRAPPRGRARRPRRRPRCR